MQKNNIEENIIDDLVTKEEAKLLSLLFSEKYSKEEIIDLQKKNDRKQVNEYYYLMLHFLASKNNWEGIEPKNKEMSNRLFSYYLGVNAMRTPWLLKIIDVLQNNQIPVLLIKGAAMLYYYDKSRPRIMNDFDVAVPEDRFDEACEAIEKSGLARKKTEGARASTFVGTEGLSSKKQMELDLHCWIYKGHNEKDTDIWERTEKIQVYGREVLILNPLDMFIHQMDTQARNYFHDEFPERRMKWLYDVRCIYELSNHFTIEDINKRCMEIGRLWTIRLSLKLFMKVYPEIFSEDELDKWFPCERKYYKQVILSKKKQLAYRELVSKKNDKGISKKIKQLKYHYCFYRMKNFDSDNTGLNKSFIAHLKENNII